MLLGVFLCTNDGPSMLWRAVTFFSPSRAEDLPVLVERVADPKTNTTIPSLVSKGRQRTKSARSVKVFGNSCNAF
jgi:hypothetical protein